MALVSATLTVNFISNYAGQHRVCWRINNTGAYDCTTVVTCTGGGNACSATITILVDNESCDPVEFDGYVQALCEDSGSLSGRDYFSSIFVPNPTCASYNLRCNSVGVLSAEVVNPGASYNPGSPPLAVVSGTGSGATAVAHVGNGGIKTFTITDGGSGWDSGGSATFPNVVANTLTGSGAGAIFDVTVTAGVITGLVLHASDVAPGVGYAVGDTFDFTPPLGGAGGPGTTTITVDSVNTGEIQYVQITAGGSGYTTPAAITIAPSPGFGGSPVNATATLTMANCADIPSAGTNCDDTPRDGIADMALGDEFILCKVGSIGSLPAGYTVNAQGCCYSCHSYHIVKDNTGGPGVLYYTDCTTRALTVVNIDDNYDEIICAVTGSVIVIDESGSTTTITEGAVCP